MQTFLIVVGSVNGGRGLGRDKLEGLSQTPGRGTIPSFSSNTKWDKISSISSISASNIFCKNNG